MSSCHITRQLLSNHQLPTFAFQAIESKSKHNAQILNESKVAATKTLTKTNPKKTNLTKPKAKPTVNTNAHNKPKQYN